MKSTLVCGLGFALLCFASPLQCALPQKLCYSGRISAAVLAPAIIGDPSPVPKLPVTEYSSEHHCLFQLHARIFLTWRQAAEFCALFNATLPVLRTHFAWQTLRNYAQNHRFWVGVVRAEAGDQDLWRWYTDGPEESPLSTSDFSRTDNRTGVEWSRSEPSNAHCGEACGVANYDGNLADYACATVPPWDPCGDESHVVRTVCQRSGLPVCRYLREPPVVPTPRDFYIIIAGTFAGLLSGTGLILFLRLIAKAVNKKTRQVKLPAA